MTTHNQPQTQPDDMEEVIYLFTILHFGCVRVVLHL